MNNDECLRFLQRVLLVAEARIASGIQLDTPLDIETGLVLIQGLRLTIETWDGKGSFVEHALEGIE